MVIARTLTKSGQAVLVLGLSKENRKRLDAGEPVDITTKTYGTIIPNRLRLVIFGGLDEDAMVEELERTIKEIEIERRPSPRATGGGA